jgi:hypothetical protein
MLPTPRDKAIVLAVYVHGRLSREQIRRLFFRKEAGSAASAAGRLASIQAAAARLKLLALAGYLSRVPAPVLKGSGQYLYSLGPLGSRLLATEYKITATPSSRRSLTASFLALNHTLEVADFYIAVKEALENSGGAILSWLGERQALHRFYHQGRRRAIAPDAYCLWSLKGREGSFFVEWERGHQSLNVIADKLDSYDAYYARRAYLEHLGEVGLTPRLVFVVPDVRRHRQLLGWLSRQQVRRRWRFLPTVLVGIRASVMASPLEAAWSNPAVVGTVKLFDDRLFPEPRLR